MMWPWQKRVAQARADTAAEIHERHTETDPLLERANKAIAESVRHQVDDPFQEALREVLRRRRDTR